MVLQHRDRDPAGRRPLGFNCEGISYGIATPRLRSPTRRGHRVSIVKDSAMVLQHEFGDVGGTGDLTITVE